MESVGWPQPAQKGLRAFQSIILLDCATMAASRAVRVMWVRPSRNVRPEEFWEEMSVSQADAMLPFGVTSRAKKGLPVNEVYVKTDEDSVGLRSSKPRKTSCAIVFDESYEAMSSSSVWS